MSDRALSRDGHFRSGIGRLGCDLPTATTMSAANDISGSSDVHHGGCHCRAVRWVFDTRKPLSALSPRACDCDFCRRHGAAWVSDPAGRLVVCAPGGRLQRYRQGSGQAEFLLCGACGVLVAVVARRDDGRLMGAVNCHAFDVQHAFADEAVVSPRLLAADAKRARWSELWTPATVDDSAP